MTCVIPSQSHDISSFLMPVIQLIYSSSVEAYLLWKCCFNYVSSMLHMCSISIKCDAQSKAWDILLVLTSVAANLCNKCPSGYSNKTAVKVILSMRSLVSIEQQSPRRPCDIKARSHRAKMNIFFSLILFRFLSVCFRGRILYLTYTKVD